MFECVFGLKVNFHKSQLFGINVDDRWLQQTVVFLNYNVGKFSFIYLGLPIGVDARKKCTWQPVLDKIKGRLSSWNSKYLSLGGKIVLLKSVLYTLPVYYLSFFKAPMGVIGAIESMFRSFPWGVGG